jgi:hypothetical protein
MAKTNLASSKLAEEILKLWEQARTFRDIQKYDGTLRHMLEHAEKHMHVKEWQEASQACEKAFGLFEPRKPLMSSDGGLREEFSIAVINLYWGIAYIGLDNLDDAIVPLQESAKNFEMAHFPFGATLARLALGKYFILHTRNMEACTQFYEGLDGLRLGLSLPLDIKTQTFKDRLEKNLGYELDALGCKITGDPDATGKDPQPITVAINKGDRFLWTIPEIPLQVVGIVDGSLPGIMVERLDDGIFSGQGDIPAGKQNFFSKDEFYSMILSGELVRWLSSKEPPLPPVPPAPLANPAPKSLPPNSVELGVLAMNQSAIRAGEPVMLLDEIAGYAIAERVIIDDVAYGFFRLDGKRAPFDFRPGYEYRAVLVEGESMNELFDAGDFVVLALPREGSLYPRPGDIVAVQILNHVSEPVPPTTLKEYRPMDDQLVELRPRSTHKEKYHSRTWRESNICVRAIAVGKLKRIMD